MTESLRLIHHGPLRPARNMAVDEALLKSSSEHLTLRFYRWSPFGLSLGFFQDQLPETEFERMTAAGIDVVRRLTGGGAILHAHELTYSLAGIDGSGLFDGPVGASYQVIHDLIIEMLKQWGINLHYADDGPKTLKHQEQPFLCFSRTTIMDLTCAGVKVLGSAKRRRAGRALQHGSLLLQAYDLESGEAGPLTLGKAIDEAAFVADFSALLGRRLGLEVFTDNLDVNEVLLADELETKHYANPKWTAQPQRNAK